MPRSLRRLLWFVAIYVVSVLVVAAVAYGLRALLFINA
jgi:hypothetical protein